MLIKISIILFFVLNINSFLSGQQNQETLAKIGSTEISKSEFIERSELSPFPGARSNPNSIETKKNILYTLIAEKILALEAVKSGFDTTSDYRKYISNIEKMNMRDQLFKKEIESRINIDNEELLDAVKRGRQNLNVKFIFSQHSSEIKYLDSLIKSGASFDSLLSFRSENFEQKDFLQVTFGTMVTSVESVLYKLQPGEISAPVNLKEGFYIFKLYSKETKNIDDEKLVSDAKKVLRSRKIDELYYYFIQNTFKDIEAEIDSVIYKNLLANLSEILHEKYTDYKPDKYTNAFLLDEYSISLIKNKFNKNTLNRKFISAANVEISLDNYLEMLKLEAPKFRDISPGIIQNTMRVFTTNLLQREIITKIAYQENLQNDPEVIKNVNVWRNHYLSKKMEAKIYSSIEVNGDEVEKFILNSDDYKNPVEVNITEVLTPDLETMEKVMNELSAGRSISELAKIYTIRDSVKNKGGEFGFVHTAKLGELGRRALEINPGEIFGPVELEEGWSIFKLNGKRNSVSNEMNPDSTETSDARENLIRKKYQEKLNDFVYGSASNLKLEVNEKILNEINLTNVNTIVYRYFGFGGKMLAVPFMKQISEWREKIEQSQKDLF